PPLPNQNPSMRYHTNGLQLVPGVPVDCLLQRRVFVGEPYKDGHWEWQAFPDARGQVLLDVSTRVAGVKIIAVTEPGGEAPRTTQALAQLWIDGRTVDRLAQQTSNGGSLNSY